jgi:HK97 family phage major capsid protein
MLRDLPFMQSYLPSELQESYFRDEDNKFINTLMAQTAAYSTSASVYAEKCIEWLSVLYSRDYDPSAIVTTAANWATLLSTKPSDYSIPGGVTITASGDVAIAGIPVMIMNGMTGTKTFVGDWSRLKIVQSSGLSINFYEQDADNVTKNLITVRAEAEVALANLRPDAFLYV